MPPAPTTVPATLKVIDALAHPHGNRILRTRVLEGTPPTVGELRGAWLRARGPDGAEADLHVVGFPLFGGSPSDERIRATGRVDLIVEGKGDTDAVERTWELELKRQ